ncbi:MAG: hypothetical protein ACTSPI_08550 [Candidatus Heimdallarchaeaceae archaeon]
MNKQNKCPDKCPVCGQEAKTGGRGNTHYYTPAERNKALKEIIDIIKNGTKEFNTLHQSAIVLAIELCGGIGEAIELLRKKHNGELKAAYWRGIADAIEAQNRIAIRDEDD